MGECVRQCDNGIRCGKWYGELHGGRWCGRWYGVLSVRESAGTVSGTVLFQACTFGVCVLGGGSWGCACGVQVRMRMRICACAFAYEQVDAVLGVTQIPPLISSSSSPSTLSAEAAALRDSCDTLLSSSLDSFSSTGPSGDSRAIGVPRSF